MEFGTTKMDTPAMVVTIFVLLFITALSLFFLIKVPYGWIWVIGMVSIPGLCYALSPRYYIFHGNELIIKKAIGTSINIPIQDIRGFLVVKNVARLKMIRTFGNGGVFGYYGMFSTMEYGPINFQLTSLKGVVIIKTTNRQYALSPSRLEDFVQLLTSTTSLIDGSIEPITKEQVRRVRATILIVPIIFYICTIILILLAYTSLPDRIAIHFDAYGNPNGWGSKISYLISGLIPSTILFILAIGVFFMIRKTTQNAKLPNFLVVVVAFIQLFILYIQLDMYWLNTYGNHVIPFLIVLGVFVIGLSGLLGLYYRTVKKITC